MKKMKYVRHVLPAFALLLIWTAGIQEAWAYFTTYARAGGNYRIELGDTTEIEEDYSDWTKKITITSREDSQPVYVRARAFGGSTYPIRYRDEYGNWEQNADDGYWYYTPVLYAGESTTELIVEIRDVPDASDMNEGQQERFHVVVVYESTPVRYDAEGRAYADWSVLLDTGTKGGTDG